jgi:hypothetical protein
LKRFPPWQDRSARSDHVYADRQRDDSDLRLSSVRLLAQKRGDHGMSKATVSWVRFAFLALPAIVLVIAIGLVVVWLLSR